MMFIIPTHDSQSTLPSISLFLSFVENNPLAEKVLSVSTEKALSDVGLVVIKA